MADLTQRARGMLRRWIQGPPEPSGEPRVLDARTALALLEESLGARTVAAEGETIAEALGLALGGERVAAWATPVELHASFPLLRDAARLRAPLVVHVAGGPLGPESRVPGVVTLLPEDLQEAVDLTVVARRLAEESLVPVVVRLDDTLASSIQTVALPPADRLRSFLGRPDDFVHPSVPDQALLFGRHRRRVPRWHDVEAPRRLASGSESPAAAVSREIFVEETMEESLRAVLTAWAEITGRRLDPSTGLWREDRHESPESVPKRAFPAPSASLPKRQARLDRLERDVPGFAARMRPVDDGAASAEPRGSVTIRWSRDGADPGSDLATRLGGLIHEFLGGWVRGSAGSLQRESGSGRLTWGPEPFPDPEEHAASDLMVWWPRAAGSVPPASLVRSVREGGMLLLPRVAGELPASLLALLERRSVELWALDSETAGAGGDKVPLEKVLGGVCALLSRRGHDTINLRRLLAAAKKLRLPGSGEDDESAAELGAGFEGVRRVAITSLRARPDVPAPAPWLPGAAAASPGDGILDDLPDLWDQMGLLHRMGESEAVAPDPRLATGALPTASARLAPLLESVGPRPAFRPTDCTACGDCWLACPHGSIEVRLLGPADLLHEGIGRAGRSGRPADALRPMVNKLASRLGPALESREAGSEGTLGPALDGAYQDLLATSPPPAARRDAIDEAFQAVRGVLADLPATGSEALFHAPQRESAGNGELLFLAIDPDTCTGCGLCVEACEPSALHFEQEDPARLEPASRAVFRDLSGLPALSSESRARVDASLGAPRGELLAPSARAVLQGSDGAEAGSGARLAVRLAVGIGAAKAVEDRRPLLREIEELREGLAGAIHDTLGRALPDRDLDTLARGLDSLDRPETELAELTARVETAFDSERIDVPRLRRLVDTARSLADLQTRLEPGAGGAETIPLSLVITGDLASSWAGRFPWNPFGIATTIAPGDAVAMSRGLAEAQRETALDRVRLLRSARHEIETPVTSRRPPTGLENLAWSDLTATERTLCPRLLLVSDESALLRELGPALALLRSDLRAALLLLDETGAIDTPLSDPGLLAALAPDRASGRASVAFPGHLARAVSTVLVDEGPGLLSLHAPSPTRGGFAPSRTLDRARDAVETGRLPLYLRSRGGAIEIAEPPNPASIPEDLRELWATLHRLAGSSAAPPSPAAVSSEEVAALERRHADEIAALEARLREGRSESDRESRLALARRLRSRLLAAMERSGTEPSGPEVPPS